MSDEGRPSSWPVVPFERYLLADDRHDEPMTFPMVFCLAGKIDHAVWRRAVVESLQRHPLLRSRLAGRGRSLRWQVDWGDAGLGDAGSTDAFSRGEDPRDDARIDLRGESPFRYRWVERGDGIDLCCRFHHAVVDGIGAIQFLGDCFARYDQLVRDGSRAKWIRLDESLLASRAERGVASRRSSAGESAAGNPGGKVSDAVFAIGSEVRRFFLRQVTPIVSDGERAGGGEPGGAIWRGGDLYQVELDAEGSDRVRRAASSRGVTLNDLALRELMLALRDANAGRGAVGRWYRITIPVNLRQRRHHRMPACNRIGYAFIDRDLSVEADPEALLLGLSQENGVIRAERLTEMFLGVLEVVARVPGLMRHLTSRRARVATTVFSNLGDPTRRFHARVSRREGVVAIGDATIRGFAAAPPVRPNMPASFLLHQLNGRVGLNVLISDQRMTADDAARMLGAWRDRLLGCDER